MTSVPNEPLNKGKKRLNSTSPVTHSLLSRKKIREYLSSTSSSEDLDKMGSENTDIEDIIKKQMEVYQTDMIAIMDNH